MDPYSFVTAFSVWANREQAQPSPAPPPPAATAPVEPGRQSEGPLDPLFKNLVYPSLTIKSPAPDQEQAKPEAKEASVKPPEAPPRVAEAKSETDSQTIGRDTASPNAATTWKMSDSSGVVWQDQDQVRLQLWVIGRDLQSLKTKVQALESRVFLSRALASVQASQTRAVVAPTQVVQRVAPVQTTGYMWVYPSPTYTYATYGYTGGGYGYSGGGCAGGRCGR